MNEQQKANKEHVDKILKGLNINDHSISFAHGFATGIIYSISAMASFANAWQLAKPWLDRTAAIFLRHADDRRESVRMAALSTDERDADASA